VVFTKEKGDVRQNPEDNLQNVREMDYSNERGSN